MIISHKYRYLFIEIPLTGSWAIRLELLENYEGVPILHKHATYPEFKRSASSSELNYFKFATVRNPLDSEVSKFYKLKSDHKEVFSDADASLQSHKIDYADTAMYQTIQEEDLTFESFFLGSRIWERPYSDMIDVSAPALDFVIRYERLNDDFTELLQLLGIEQLRSIPIQNKTQGRSREWDSYYTPRMIARAKKIYGPFMDKWDYEFPSDWGPSGLSGIDKFEYHLSVLMKKMYLAHIRYSDTFYSVWLRKLNSTLKQRVYR